VQRAYRTSTLVTSFAIALLGLAMVVSTLVRGGGPLALGVVLGVLFTLLGAGRAWLARPGAGREA
jgi:hypothetical protein